MYDIVIVGAGCAGMTAAVYALRAGKTVLILESNGIGGQIAFSPRVENFPSIKQISGSDFSNNLFEQASELGAEFEFENVTAIEDNGSVKTVVTEDSKHECKAVILATGVAHRSLGVDGEQDLIGSGISYCAVCDGVFFKGKTVAVIGGGNTALQDAIYLSQYCEKIYLVHRRDEFRGDISLVDRLRDKSNVEFVLNSTVKTIHGTDSIEGITVLDTKTNKTRDISLDGMFVAVGQVPQNSAFSELVKLDSAGFIDAGEDCKTSHPGIFAAGDCRTKEIRQLVTAASDGAVAATAACEYIID